MTAMSATDLQSLIMAVGEIRGQMRELVHATNNNAQALTGVTTAIAKLEAIPTDIAKFEARLATYEARLTALETAEHKRKGAVSFWAWFIQSPAIGWLATAGIGAWAILQGKTGQ